jgi:xanthine/uracil/vitamin C permease (AzgA family)
MTHAITVGIGLLIALIGLEWGGVVPTFLKLDIVGALTPALLDAVLGIAFGFIAYAVLKPATGRAAELDWLAYAFAALFVLRYALL